MSGRAESASAKRARRGRDSSIVWTGAIPWCLSEYMEVAGLLHALWTLPFTARRGRGADRHPTFSYVEVVDHARREDARLGCGRPIDTTRCRDSMSAAMFRRLTLYGLILMLGITPLLGFAAGDSSVAISSQHPRQATPHQSDGPRFVWKTTPGVSVRATPLAADDSSDRLCIEPSARLALAIAPPPFVPPRV